MRGRLVRWLVRSLKPHGLTRYPFRVDQIHSPSGHAASDSSGAAVFSGVAA